MLAIEETMLVLLAAGRSERFGGGKLAADLGGVPLGLHVVHALAELPFRARVAVVGPAALDYAAHGFRVIRNGDPARDMASSLRLGVAAAEGAAVLLALADMPCVTATHVRRLFDAAEGDHAVVASTNGARPSPPALFGRARFAALLQVTGDKGARELIAGARHVPAPAGELVDVDTVEELEALRSALTM